MYTNDVYYNVKDKDLIIRAANETGYYHKPTYYRNYIKKSYGRDVTTAHIVKVLGTYKQRVKNMETTIQRKLLELLDLTTNDVNLIISILRRLQNDRLETWQLLRHYNR